MANWQRTLDLVDVFDKAYAREITVQELVTHVATRLEALTPFHIHRIEEEKVRLVEEFREIADDPSAEFSDFDALLHDLYDWADTPVGGAFPDTKRACWIKTF